MTKPTVLFLIDGLQAGGAERSLLELCKWFKKVDPIVVVLSDSSELQHEFEQAGIQTIVHPLPRNYRFRKNAKKLLPLIEEIQPKLIHAYLFHADFTLRNLNYTCPKVTGLVSNSYSKRRLAQLGWSLRMKIYFLRVWDILSYSIIDHFIANSLVIKEAYQTQLSFKESKIGVIYRGRDISQFKTKEIYYPASFNFIAVGRLVASKGYQELLTAFSLFHASHPKSSLTICGEGPERKNLELLIEQMGLVKEVHLLGAVNDIPQRLHQYDYFIFPTHYEGLPGALIEAMMARLPIICSAIPENKECLSEDMCLFHEVGNAADILEKMQAAIVLEDWEIRTAKAYAYAVEHFEIGKIVQQYEDTYLKLITSCAE